MLPGLLPRLLSAVLVFRPTLHKAFLVEEIGVGPGFAGIPIDMMPEDSAVTIEACHWGLARNEQAHANCDATA